KIHKRITEMNFDLIHILLWFIRSIFIKKNQKKDPCDYYVTWRRYTNRAGQKHSSISYETHPKKGQYGHYFKQ
ncbi:hypothetical protein, partial [Parabacteroides sp. AM58-2XD]|uniref:hypothetical protein n=1 Tax=Parabacteroides sp. AM58-2XD TaxID=2292362 RepID=UPI001F2CFAC2